MDKDVINDILLTFNGDYEEVVFENGKLKRPHPSCSYGYTVEIITGDIPVIEKGWDNPRGYNIVSIDYSGDTLVLNHKSNEPDMYGDNIDKIKAAKYDEDVRILISGRSGYFVLKEDIDKLSVSTRECEEEEY